MEAGLFFVDSVFYNSLGLFFVALGVLVSVRFAGYPDLTADGSFTLGAALYALSVAQGLSPIYALPLAAVGGVFAGFSTAILNQFFHIGKIISGVLVMVSLVLIVPYFSGNATVGLLRTENMFTVVARADADLGSLIAQGASYTPHIIFSALVLALLASVSVLLWIFFRSGFGVRMRYCGSATDPNLLTLRTRTRLLCAGLALGNALIACGGAIEVERTGGFSPHMGTGIILVGIAVVVLGESLIKSFTQRVNLYLLQYLGACFIGVLAYTLIIQAILSSSSAFVDIRLLSTLVLVVVLAYAAYFHSNARELF